MANRTVRRAGLPDICFQDGKTVSGEYTLGHRRAWHYTRKKGGYNEGRDFFWVHFEIGHQDPLRVKLHVESPPAVSKTKKKTVPDPVLNSIKIRLVQQLLEHPFQHLCAERGLHFASGKRLDPEQLQTNVSTQVFSVLLQEEQAAPELDERIVFVIDQLGQEIDSLLAEFKAELYEEFLYD